MKKISPKLSLVVLLVTLGMVTLNSQQVGDPVIIKLKEGDNIIGLIAQQNDSILIIKNQNFDSLIVARNTIKKVNTFVLNKNGSLWDCNRASNRSIISPTGFGLKKGEAYARMAGVLFHSFSYGLSDYLTVSAGIELEQPRIFGSDNFSLGYSISAKLIIPIIKDQISFGGGISYINGSAWDWIPFNSSRSNSISGNNKRVHEGIFYGVGSFGNRDDNFSIGIAYGRNRDGWSEKPAVFFNGMLRITERVSFLAEGWLYGFNEDKIFFLDDGSSIIIETITYKRRLLLGARFIAGNVILEPALSIPEKRDSDHVLLPWFSLTIPIG